MNAPGQDDASACAMLERAFANLGAAPDAARVMAAQLLKRARQVATERSVSEAEVLAGLLAKVVSGRRGDYTGAEAPPDSGLT